MTSRMTPGKLGRVPNQPKNKAYAIRLDPERVEKLIEQSKVEGINFSETIRNAIDAYIENPPPPPPAEEPPEDGKVSTTS